METLTWVSNVDNGRSVLEVVKRYDLPRSGHVYTHTEAVDTLTDTVSTSADRESTPPASPPSRQVGNSVLETILRMRKEANTQMWRLRIRSEKALRDLSLCLGPRNARGS